MNKYFQAIGVVVMLAGISACSAKKEHTYVGGNLQTKEILCTEPRPEVCTMEYLPVCALQQNGSYKTYSNGCNACSNSSVTSYREGACE